MCYSSADGLLTECALDLVCGRLGRVGGLLLCSLGCGCSLVLYLVGSSCGFLLAILDSSLGCVSGLVFQGVGLLGYRADSAVGLGLKLVEYVDCGGIFVCTTGATSLR